MTSVRDISMNCGLWQLIQLWASLQRVFSTWIQLEIKFKSQLESNLIFNLNFPHQLFEQRHDVFFKSCCNLIFNLNFQLQFSTHIQVQLSTWNRRKRSYCEIVGLWEKTTIKRNLIGRRKIRLFSRLFARRKNSRCWHGNRRSNIQLENHVQLENLFSSIFYLFFTKQNLSVLFQVENVL